MSKYHGSSAALHTTTKTIHLHRADNPVRGVNAKVIISVTPPLITCSSLPITPFYICAIITRYTKEVGLVIRNPLGNVGDAGLILGSGRSSGGNGSPLQYSCPGNPMDRGAQQTTVPRVAKSQTRLSD